MRREWEGKVKKKKMKERKDKRGLRGRNAIEDESWKRSKEMEKGGMGFSLLRRIHASFLSCLFIRLVD